MAAKAVISAAAASRSRSNQSAGRKKRRLEKDEFKQRMAWGIGITLAIGAGVLIYINYEDLKRRRELKERLELQVGQVNLDQKAIEIYDAFYNADWAGLTEDEESAIAALLSVPKNYVNQLALVYNAKYGKSLYNDFRRFLQSDQYSRVANHLN